MTLKPCLNQILFTGRIYYIYIMYLSVCIHISVFVQQPFHIRMYFSMTPFVCVHNVLFLYFLFMPQSM